MAQEYEVREEFRSHSLSQLMDDHVLCFQGVGDIQAELLKQYFNIASVRDLANWSYFLWSLEIQELALHGGDLTRTPMRQIVETKNPTFKVRERALDLTPDKLMLSSVADLEGLTPAQDLALYDIFRITNIAQLAHNRIMLEARVIQYLESQSRQAAGETSPAEGVDFVLGRPPGAAAQRAAEELKANRDERLLAMESETREHVQERLATLRERGRARGAAAAGEQPAAAAAGAATAERLESIRTSRERGTVDTSRSLRRPGEAEARESRADAARAASGVMASRAATTERAAGPSMSSRAAAVLAARGVGAATESGASQRPGGTGGGGAATARTGATASTATATATRAAATEVPPGAATPAPPASARSRRVPQILLGGAAVLVVVAAGLVYVLRSGTPPTTQTAPPGSAPGAPGTAAPPGTTAQPGAKPVAPGAAARSGKAAGVAGTEAPSGTSGAPGAAKTIHTVREGQSLWRISRRYYQFGHDWPVIYKENQDQIDDPDLIYPKQQFRIPRLP